MMRWTWFVLAWVVAVPAWADPPSFVPPRKTARVPQAEAPAAQPSSDRRTRRGRLTVQPTAAQLPGARLPNTHGQVWREYDLRPYTMHANWSARPEQIVIDWVLRLTGFEAWHSDVPAMLCADRQTLWAYHTPEVQQVVADTVARFTQPQARRHVFSLHVITFSRPNWRVHLHRVAQAVPVQSQGVQAWVLRREDATMILAKLAQRQDFREHTSPQLVIENGQPYSLTRTRPRNYVQDIQLKGDALPGFEVVGGRIEEGFSLEVAPLVSRDQKTVDVVIKCHVDQLERFHPVLLDLPTPVGGQQRIKVDVPQVCQCRLQEQFRWPEDQVLVVCLGRVPMPNHLEPGLVPLRLGAAAPARADLIIWLECRERPASEDPVRAAGRPRNYHGRY